MEIALALFDFIPVTLFFIATIILQKCFYYHMSKYSFALLAAGSIMILTAGITKATYKLLYYGAGLDLYRLDHLFFPIQSLGFVLAFLGLLILIVEEKKKNKLHSSSILLLATLVEEEGKTIINDTMIYVVLQIIGSSGIYGILSYYAVKMKKKWVVVLMAVAFIAMLGMGFLSTRISRATGNMYITYNWMAELVNTLGQASFLTGVILLNKAGLKDFSLEQK
jgi:uncharacterized membrane protein (Fun14 family)